MSLFFPKGQVPDPFPKGSEKSLGLPEMKESQDISRHSQDMRVKPPRPEGDSQTTYIPTDFVFHINILSLAGLEPIRKKHVAH